MRFRATTGFVAGVLTLSSAASAAPAPVAFGDAGPARDVPADSAVRRSWIASLEGVMQAPIDFGFRAGVQTPFGLRVFGGYGWVPSFYTAAFTGLADASVDDPRARAVLDEAALVGNTWRIGAGIRPFRRLGLYVDAGYARALLDASLDSVDVPELRRQSGGYDMSTRLDLWFVEFGYQVEVGDRLLLAAGLGVLGTFNANTAFSARGGAPSDPGLAEAAGDVDDAIESYGFVPTLSLRIGFDLI